MQEYFDLTDEMLLDYAESIATVMEREYIYISTNHVGLYEKYGYKLYRKSEIEKIQKSQLGGLEKIPNRGLRNFRLYLPTSVAGINYTL